MKVRSDYVSNSSSSSFIVITPTGSDNTSTIMSQFAHYKEDWQAYEFPNTAYKHQFGWEWEDTCTFGGKLNFVGLQLCYLLELKMSKRKTSYKLKYEGKDFDRLYDMVRKVCKEKFGFNAKLNTDVFKVGLWENPDKGGYYTHLDMDYDYYIDHQSCATEASCMEMFDSEDALYDFLRTEDSYIRGGNDNG